MSPENLPVDVRIRRAGAEDAAAIATILKLAFAEFEIQYTPKGFAATTPDAPQVLQRIDEGPVWIASVAHGILGTASAVARGEEGLYVRGVAVVPSARGQGIAESLMREIERFANSTGYGRLYLTTTPFLHGAIRLYERFGFAHVPDGVEDLFGTPLLLMKKTL
jgi:GNAT superfamily N-acetyltransferase